MSPAHLPFGQMWSDWGTILLTGQNSKKMEVVSARQSVLGFETIGKFFKYYRFANALH